MRLACRNGSETRFSGFEGVLGGAEGVLKGSREACVRLSLEPPSCAGLRADWLMDWFVGGVGEVAEGIPRATEWASGDPRRMVGVG